MQMLGKSKNYSIVILKKGTNDNIAERQQIIWEHGRRNFQLREAGLLSIVVLLWKKTIFVVLEFLMQTSKE